MNNKDRSRHSFLFLMQLLFVAILGFNVYVVARYDSFRQQFRPTGMSDQQFSGRLVGLILLLTACVILLTIASKKKEIKQIDSSSILQIDFAFLLRLVAIIANYITLNRVVYDYNDSGAILVFVILTFTFVACAVLLLFHESSYDDKLYLLCWAYAFATPLIVVVALVVHFPSQELRRFFNFDISEYFVNPPVTAALLVLPHFLVSFTNPSRHRSSIERIIDIIVYCSFAATMAMYVPGTIKGVQWYDAFSGDKQPFAAVIVALYSVLFFISLEVLRPETYVLPGKGIFVLVLKHIALLSLVSASVGVLIYSVAALSRGGHGIRFIPFGHALVGIGAGLVMPLWYVVYEKSLLPWLRTRVGQSAQSALPTSTA